MMTLSWIILGLIKLTVSVVTLTTLLSYSVAWYERANSRPDLIDRRFTSRGVFIAAWMIILETGCLLLTILLRPFGWTHSDGLQDAETSKPPVILLHGLFQNRSCMYWVQNRLRAAGYSQTISINTPPWRNLETLTEELAKKIDELRIKLNVEKFILVGHSMGGIIARNYVQNRGGAAHVSDLITLGSPHHGSKLAPFAVSQMGKSLLPGSSFLQAFNKVTWPKVTRAVSIYTRYDNIVLPTDSSKMKGAENIELDGMGHTGLLFHPRSVQAVIDAVENKKDENN